MRLPPDIVPGQLISRHGRTRLHRFVIGVALVFLVLGAALPLLLVSGARVAPEARLLIFGTAALLFLIGAALAIAWRLIGPATVLDLHLHGIIVRDVRTRSDRFVPFMAMSDLYLYRTGRHTGGLINALAFRCSPDDAWVDVLENRGDAFRLRGEIIEGQLRERGPLALRALEAGETLTFHAVGDTDRGVKRITGGALSIPSKPVRLSREGVTVDERFIPIGDIGSLDEGGRSGPLRLLGNRGDTLWSVHYLSLFSADLFVVLMRTMIEAHLYGIDRAKGG